MSTVSRESCSLQSWIPQPTHCLAFSSQAGANNTDMLAVHTCPIHKHILTEGRQITGSGEFDRAYSCTLTPLLITLCSPPDTLDEANISEGLISRSPIKQETVRLVVSGRMETVKQLPC